MKTFKNIWIFLFGVCIGFGVLWIVIDEKIDNELIEAYEIGYEKGTEDTDEWYVENLLEGNIYYDDERVHYSDGRIRTNRITIYGA